MKQREVPESVQTDNPMTLAAEKLSIPVLLVRGRLSELVSEESVHKFKQLVPHSDFVDVSDAGHMVAGDKNDSFTDAILAFMNKQQTKS